MHTPEAPGIDIGHVKTLNDQWTWTPPLVAENDDEHLAGPESITAEDIERMFNTQLDPGTGGDGLEEGVDIDQVYDIFELESIRKGVVPRGQEEDTNIHSGTSGANSSEITALVTLATPTFASIRQDPSRPVLPRRHLARACASFAINTRQLRVGK